MAPSEAITPPATRTASAALPVGNVQAPQLTRHVAHVHTITLAICIGIQNCHVTRDSMRHLVKGARHRLGLFPQHSAIDCIHNVEAVSIRIARWNVALCIFCVVIAATKDQHQSLWILRGAAGLDSTQVGVDQDCCTKLPRSRSQVHMNFGLSLSVTSSA